MEITSFPFLNQDDWSHFFGFFQEMETHNSNNNNSISNTNSNSKKRRRNEDNGFNSGDDEDNKEVSKKTAIKEIIASLLLLEEEEKSEEEKWVMDSEVDKAVFESNHKQKTQAMHDYYVNFQNQFSDLDDSHLLKTKKARCSASTALATASASASAIVSDDNASADISIQSGGGGRGQHRRLWVKDRSKAWWETCNHPDFPEEEFRKWFRMSRATFDMICEELDSAVTKKDTMLRAAIPVRQRVAVCIWRLATGEPLRLVSKRFGLGISTCHKLVLEVCSAIRTVLMPKFLQWPNEEGVKKISREFESISGIPNVAGSVYTTHIPIIAPKISVAAYFNKRHTERNQKTSYSITVQGVVDDKGVFTDVCIGWPGSMSDDQVLEKSALFQRAHRGLLKNVWIVGNSGYPLMDWVMVPYTQNNVNWAQHKFNEKIGEIQSVAKEAFARLKGRWSCLQKRTEVKLQDLPVVLGACCVLHNICEMRNEELDPEMKFELFDDEMVPEDSVRSRNSVQVRDHIAHNLLHHGLGGTSFL